VAIETYRHLDAVEGIDIAGIYKGDLICLATNTRKAPLDDEHVLGYRPPALQVPDLPG